MPFGGTRTDQLFPFAGNRVMVGRVTLLTYVHGLPATRESSVSAVSGPFTGGACGIVRGQMGISVPPGGGRQPVCAPYSGE